ncbi:MAG: amidohydrolase family protein [Methylomonas sp.]|jgi:mannonate dehydratase
MPYRKIAAEFNFSRRRFLYLAAGGLMGVAQPSSAALLKLANPCLDPKDTPRTDLESRAWEGINPADWWDSHTHIVGSGDGGSGIYISPDMNAPFLHPWQTLQHWFYANAACTGAYGGQDIAFVNRLLALMAAMPVGAKVMLLALDKVYTTDGDFDPAHTAFFVPNGYAKSLAKRYPQYFEWVASIHPYRRDCVAELEQAAAGGARAIKWLPPVMGIDPQSPLCDNFYRAAAGLNMPIISHGGEEGAVHGANRSEYGNPLRMQRALDSGVKVVIAHCASLGMEVDDQGRKVRSFDVFAGMMAQNQWRDRLYGDISSILLRNHDSEVIKTLLTETAWQTRLVNGSDYPLTGVLPLTSPAALCKSGFFPEDYIPALAALQDYHPFRFDFVLKRCLLWRGRRFADSVFATRRVFENKERA